MTLEEGNHLEVPAEKAERKYDPLPEGNYAIVALDLDTTGKRLIDEIVQVAVYCPDSSYAQYIMPLMNLNPAARQRHQVRVITVGFFRMLKSMQTYKVMKTKTEVAALNDFLSYLEKVKAADPNCKGIVLLFHEQRKFVPYMVIEAMKKYNLLTKFMEIVKSFVNTYPIAVEKCGNSMKYLSLRQTAKVLLNPNNNEIEKAKVEQSEEGATSIDSPTASETAATIAEIPAGTSTQASPTMSSPPHPHRGSNNAELESFEGNAAVRAKLSYDIGQQLARGIENRDEMSPEELNDKFMRLALSYAHSVDHEIEELKDQERILERQSSLRPIFLQYFRTTLHHRVKAVTFRRVLAELGFDLEALQALWNATKKDGMKDVLAKAEELKPEDRDELIEILDHHFDPEKQAVKPRVLRRSASRRRRRPMGNNNNNNQNMNNNNLPMEDMNNNNNNNNIMKNKENVGNKNFNQGAGGDGPKNQRQKRSPRRSFRRSRGMNRGLAAAN